MSAYESKRTLIDLPGSKMWTYGKGVFADAPLISRLGGVAVGLLIFFGFGRRILWGLGGGLLAFLLIDLLSIH